MASDDGDGWSGRVRAWVASAPFPRILPFLVFMLFVAASSTLPAPVPVPPGEFDSRWLYAARAVVVAGLVLLLWRRFDELRPAAPLRAIDWVLSIACGVVVLVIWVNLDRGWVTFPLGEGFDPRRHGTASIDWTLTLLRLLGLVLVVPVIEELFWRSLLMRWLHGPDFLDVAPARVGVRALLISSLLFALEHTQWLAGLIAGLAYGLLYVRTQNLWAPIVAHAITNGLLGAYVLATGDWRFW